MTLIPWISSAMTRSTTGIVEANKIRHFLHTIILFTLTLLIRLNKILCLDITDKTLLDQTIVTNLDPILILYFLL